MDTTGAGDAFAAALLVGLLEASSGRRIEIPARPALEAILTVANATAALSIERRGGIPSLPSRRRVAAFVRSGPRTAERAR